MVRGISQRRRLAGTHAFSTALAIAALAIAVVGGCGGSDPQQPEGSSGGSSHAAGSAGGSSDTSPRTVRPVGGSRAAAPSPGGAGVAPEWARKAVERARRNRAEDDRERIADAREKETARAKTAAARMRIQAALDKAGQMILDGKWDEAQTAYRVIQAGSGGDGNLWKYGKKEAAKALKGMEEAGRAKPALRNGAARNDPLTAGARKIAEASDAKLRAEFELDELRAATANRLRGWKHEKLTYAPTAGHFQALFWMSFSSAPVAVPDSKMLEMAQSLTKEAAPAVAAYEKAKKHSGIDLFIAELAAADRDTRRESVKTLHSLGPAAEPAVPALIKTMQDEDSYVSKMALKAILAIGPGASDAGKVLVGMLASDLDSSGDVLDVLVDMDLAGAGVEQELTDLWIGSYNSAFTWVLMKLDPKMTKPIAVALNVAQSDGDRGRRINALVKLGNLGPLAVSTIPAVAKIATDQQQEARIRGRACSVLGKLDPTGKQSAPVLATCLLDDDRDVQRNSFEALHSLGPAAKPALPALRKYVENAPGQNKRRAESLIRKLGG